MEELNTVINLDVSDVIKNKSFKKTRLNDVLEAITIINSKLELNYVLKQVIHFATEITNTVAGSIILTSDKDNDLIIAYPTGPASDSISNTKFPRTKGIAGLCVSTAQIVLIQDAKRSPYHFEQIDKSTGFKTKSILCIPLSIKGNIIGCIEFINKRDSKKFSDEDIVVATIMSNLAAISIKNAETYEKLQQKNLTLESQFPLSNSLGVSKNRDAKIIFESINKLKDTKSTVLVLGESGTGKSILARTIHKQSNRQEYPFITVNCSMYSKTLLESELFGHEKGAFTGADKLKKGRFELANEGTVFLDELGEIDKSIQTKLLRILQEKVFERVGGTETLSTDVRIIAATNTDLEKAVEEGHFRKDLYYRIKVIVFKLPPLRERREDIPFLAQFFLEKYSNELNKPVCRLDGESMNALQGYDYPGNIRELENIIERTVVLAEDTTINIKGLPYEIQQRKDYSDIQTTRPEKTLSFCDMEKDAVHKALHECSWNQSMAARLLGISRNKLRYRIKKYKIADLND